MSSKHTWDLQELLNFLMGRKTNDPRDTAPQANRLLGAEEVWGGWEVQSLGTAGSMG